MWGGLVLDQPKEWDLVLRALLKREDLADGLMDSCVYCRSAHRGLRSYFMGPSQDPFIMIALELVSWAVSFFTCPVKWFLKITFIQWPR